MSAGGLALQGAHAPLRLLERLGRADPGDLAPVRGGRDEQVGLRAVAEWESEQGRFSAAELEAARRRVADEVRGPARPRCADRELVQAERAAAQFVLGVQEAPTAAWTVGLRGRRCSTLLSTR